MLNDAFISHAVSNDLNKRGTRFIINYSCLTCQLTQLFSRSERLTLSLVKACELIKSR